jgi:hypothetical protein
MMSRGLCYQPICAGELAGRETVKGGYVTESRMRVYITSESQMRSDYGRGAGTQQGRQQEANQQVVEDDDTHSDDDSGVKLDRSWMDGFRARNCAHRQRLRRGQCRSRVGRWMSAAHSWRDRNFVAKWSVVLS